MTDLGHQSVTPVKKAEDRPEERHLSSRLIQSPEIIPTISSIGIPSPACCYSRNPREAICCWQRRAVLRSGYVWIDTFAANSTTRNGEKPPLSTCESKTFRLTDRINLAGDELKKLAASALSRSQVRDMEHSVSRRLLWIGSSWSGTLFVIWTRDNVGCAETTRRLSGHLIKGMGIWLS